MEIEKEILDKTVHCTKDFDCLRNNNICCKVENCVDKKVHFVECSEIFCNYKMKFGRSYICTCPTRKEIYNKYRRQILQKKDEKLRQLWLLRQDKKKKKEKKISHSDKFSDFHFRLQFLDNSKRSRQTSDLKNLQTRQREFKKNY